MVKFVEEASVGHGATVSNKVELVARVSEPIFKVPNHEPIHVWSVCDALDDQFVFLTLIQSHGIICDRFLQSNHIARNITSILTDHIAQAPQLVGVALPRRNVAGLEDKKQLIAVRLFLHQQLQTGNYITVEGSYCF